MLNQITPLTSQTPTGNPTLDAIHALPSESKQALANAHDQIVSQHLQQIQPPQMGSGMPGVQATPEATQAASPALPHIAAPRQQVPTLGPAPMDVSANQAEYSRLTDPTQESSKSGIAQIHNPWARIPLQIADAVGSTFAPRLMQALPGTQLHHNMLVGEQAGAIKEGETEANEQQKRGLDAAQTAYNDARPEIEDAKNETNLVKTQLNDAYKREALGEKTHNDSLKSQISALGRGLTVDENGNVAVDPDSPVTKRLNAQNEYFGAREDLAKAQAALTRAKNDPNSPAYQLALRNSELAQRRLAIAEGNLNLRGQEVSARLYGTDTQGNALPGAMETPDGQVVGTAFQGNVKPTASQMTKADLANSMKLQIHTMRDILARHPEFAGPGAGRYQQFEAWLGSQDPDAQRFLTAQNFAAEHGAGMFGARNYNVIKDIKGNFRMSQNLGAVTAALDQADKTADEFAKAGTRHYAQGGKHSNTTSGGNGGTQRFVVNGIEYNIPTEKVAAFKKAKGLQ